MRAETSNRCTVLSSSNARTDMCSMTASAPNKPMELLYTDDLVPVTETEELLLEMLRE